MLTKQIFFCWIAGECLQTNKTLPISNNSVHVVYGEFIVGSKKWEMFKGFKTNNRITTKGKELLLILLLQLLHYASY